MQLSQKPLNVCVSFLLLSVLPAMAARGPPPDGAEKGRSLLATPTPTADPAPTSVTVPVSACVTQCVNEALKQGGCSSLSDKLCFCTQLALAASIQFCLERSCPTSDQAAALGLYQETCAVPLSSLLPPVLDSSPPPAASPTPSKAPTATQPAPSASASPAATDSPPASQQTTATPTPTPAATTAPPDPRGSVSTDTDDVQVTVTVSTVNPDASALNPPANGAARTGGRVLGAGAALLVAAWTF